MVAISDVDRLTVELNIYEIDYTPSKKTAKITFVLTTKYGDYSPDSFHFDNTIRPSDQVITNIKEQVDKNNETLNTQLEKIKDRITALLILDDSIDVRLHDVRIELLDIAKRGLTED